MSEVADALCDVLDTLPASLADIPRVDNLLFFEEDALEGNSNLYAIQKWDNALAEAKKFTKRLLEANSIGLAK